MRQVIVIGGGETFDTYVDYVIFLESMKFDPTPKDGKGWKGNLQEDLGKEYSVLYPKMPSPLNAKYKEWEIYFKEVLKWVEDGAIFVGHSLGGLFLLKYIDGHYGMKSIKGVVFVSSPVPGKEGFADFQLPPSHFPERFGQVHIFHSQDDTTVPAKEAYLLQSMFIDSTMHMSKDGGHFTNTEHLPELVKVIKSI